jgi:uridine phosphorylase
MAYHLGDLRTSARTAVITGDPDRVPTLASELGAAGSPHVNRGYVCIEVERNDEPVLVASSGIGGPSTAIVVEELSQLGLRQIIRVGTCGALHGDVRAGDVVISSGAVRDEGTSAQYLPLSIPTVPAPDLLAGILTAARAMDVRYHIGLTHSKDAYYAEQPDGLPLADEWRARWSMLRAVGVLATEMEAAALFAVATVRRLQAAALFVPVDETISRDSALASLCIAAAVGVMGADLSRGIS